MNESRLLVYTHREPIRWGDMDALGHVNNTVYFRYMEQARIGWLYEQADGRYGAAGEGPVIVNASCTFLAPIVYPGDVEVRMYLDDVGRTSVASQYDLYVDGSKCAEGTAKIVWINIATGRPTPLPDLITAPVRALAQQHEQQQQNG